MTVGGNSLRIQTPAFFSERGPFKSDGHYTFGLNETDCAGLFPMVNKLERNVNACLEETIPTGVPELLAAQLHNNPKVRPSINSVGRLYLRTSKDCQIYNWLGNENYEGELARGTYQLMVRASTIFLGAHGSTGYAASIQLRICQIRYRPEPRVDEKPRFLFMAENGDDFSVNNMPGNQMQAVELGLLYGDDDTLPVVDEPEPVPQTPKISRKRPATLTRTKKSKKTNALLDSFFEELDMGSRPEYGPEAQRVNYSPGMWDNAVY
jgi:hypothetical protein